MIAVGIDPGAMTGIAVLEKGVLTYCRQWPVDRAIGELHDILEHLPVAEGAEGLVVAVEMPSRNKNLFRTSGKLNPMSLVKNGESAGRLHGIVEAMQLSLSEAERERLLLLEAKPGRRRRKMSIEEFWIAAHGSPFLEERKGNRAPGEHARDSYSIATWAEGEARLKLRIASARGE